MLLTPFEVFQLLSSLEVAKKVRARNSNYGLSLDFTLYSWTWSLTHTIANGLYCFLPKVQLQHAQRYPLQLKILISCLLTALLFAQFCVCTFLVKKCFLDLRSQESLSLVCKIVLLSCSGIFYCFFWHYYHAKATINLLDLADCLHNIGSLAFACRLIPQVSLNWFLSCFPLSKTFMILQYMGALYVSLIFLVSYIVGLSWLQLPISLPSHIVIVANWGGIAMLAFQQRLYRSHDILPRMQKTAIEP